MGSFSLDQARESANKTFPASEVPLDDGTVVKLLNPLRLPEEKRERLTSFDLKDPEAKTLDVLGGFLKTVAETDEAGEKLIDALDGDVALLLEVVNFYVKDQNLGKASKSRRGSTSTAKESTSTSDDSTDSTSSD